MISRRTNKKTAGRLSGGFIVKINDHFRE